MVTHVKIASGYDSIMDYEFDTGWIRFLFQSGYKCEGWIQMWFRLELKDGYKCYDC